MLYARRLPTIAAIAALMIVPALGQNHPLTTVFEDTNFQLTGITVAKSGRMFVNYPRWSDRYLNAVVEILPDGTTKPFPDEQWNRWDMKPGTARTHFVCVQSVVADDQDNLWVVDPAAPLLTSPVPSGPKLVKINLQTNQVAQIIPFGRLIARADSYLNDVRIDTARQVAYLTDSGAGGIVVVDLATGQSHRALDRDPSVLVEPGVGIAVNGKPVIGPTGQPPTFNSDGIALSPDGEYLYYHAVTAKMLYRVKTSALRSPNYWFEAYAAVEQVATTFPVDGLWIDSQGRLYLSDINNSAVVRRNIDGSLETLVSDPRLMWPDTFSEGPDGAIYITASHINEGPVYNQGVSVRTQPYAVFKLQP